MSDLTTEQKQPTPHQHIAADTYSHPAYKPSRFEETCVCGATRYRVTGGPWTQWESDSGPLSRTGNDTAQG